MYMKIQARVFILCLNLCIVVLLITGNDPVFVNTDSNNGFGWGQFGVSLYVDIM